MLKTFCSASSGTLELPYPSLLSELCISAQKHQSWTLSQSSTRSLRLAATSSIPLMRMLVALRKRSSGAGSQHGLRTLPTGLCSPARGASAVRASMRRRHLHRSVIPASDPTNRCYVMQRSQLLLPIGCRTASGSRRRLEGQRRIASDMPLAISRATSESFACGRTPALVSVLSSRSSKRMTRTTRLWLA